MSTTKTVSLFSENRPYNPMKTKKAMGADCFHGFISYETKKKRRLHLRKGAASC